VALVSRGNGSYGVTVLHPLALMVRRKETAASMPEWAGIGMVLGGLLASGWMVVATLSHGAWVVGLVGSTIFVPALFATVGHLFPEDRR
jgi:hypothetical protein